jgi:hypothetical protein
MLSACDDSLMSDTETIEHLITRYYEAHTAEDPSLIGHEAFAEPPLQRILVDELGGDTFEQAFLEGNLLNPEDGYDRTAELGKAEYRVDVSGDSATARVVPNGPSFTFVREAGRWKIAGFE